MNRFLVCAERACRKYKSWLKVLVFVAVAAVNCSTAFANENAGKPSDFNWSAQWVGVEQDSTPNQWLCFRKTIQLNAVPEDATVRIACDSKYWLWVNGKLIVREGQLKRGPTPDDSYYDQIELSKHLQVGNNSIAILVWYFGKHGFSHNSSGVAALVFDGQFGDLPVRSDDTWIAFQHPAFGDTSPPHPNFRLPESNIRFDARQDLIDDRGNRWFETAFDDDQWPNAKTLGSPPDKRWGDLHLRPIPQWKDFGLKDYTNQQDLDLPRVSDGKIIKAKLPYNAQVNPVLTIRAEAGQTIDIRMDNYQGGSAPNVRAEYVTRKGEQSYENFGWMNGHEVHYQIPKGVEIIDLKFRETGFETEFAGRFHCDDEFLNRFHQKAARTLYLAMRDTYYDCPDRERAQWWGDVVLEMNESFYMLDVRSHSLARKGILELMAWQRPDDTIYSPIPSGNYDSELPTQMLASVGYFGFWTYVLYTGDLDTIEHVYPRVKRYMNLWRQDKDGLVIPRKGGWTWGDWGKNKDMPLLFNTWYYLAVRGQANMATALGNTDEAALLEEKLVRLKTAFNKTFWNGSEYRSPGYEGLTDDRGHALAVVSGIADPQKCDAIAEVFRQQLHSSPYMEKYVMEALYQMRRPKQAVARISKRYKKMVDAETTTLWEGWGIGKEGFGGGTTNHAWSGGPLTQYVAGIKPTAIGFQAYEVRPQLGPLTEVRVVVQTVAGELKVDYLETKKQVSLNLVSPIGTTGKICVPDDSVRSIRESDIVVWSKSKEDQDNGQPHKSIKFLRQTDGYIEFEVLPGDYSFVGQK